MNERREDNPLAPHLRRMVEAGASDLYLRAGHTPTLRVRDELVETDAPAPTAQDLATFRDALLTPMALKRFEQSPDVDAACTLADGTRFRVNLFLQQGELALVARHVPSGRIDLGELNLPEPVARLAERRRGLVLVVGPTGCGKSTTLAGLVHRINATRREHIVTVEDPIEFVHAEERALIHQRQVGYDTRSFATALRHVVRQSPDTILIGEMRDADTMATALNAALTGHLVLTTLHTTSVAQSIDRMLAYFPADARPQARADLAQTLLGMVAMRLLPTVDGAARVPACEVLLGTPTVRRALNENRLDEVETLMQRGGEHGMQTLTQALVDLCRAGTVRFEDALPHAPNPEAFRLQMEGIQTGIESLPGGEHR